MLRRLLVLWLILSLSGLGLAGASLAAQSLGDHDTTAGLALPGGEPLVDHDCTHLCHVGAHLLGLGGGLHGLAALLPAGLPPAAPDAGLVRRDDQPPVPPPCLHA